jgi:translation initiation factor IF-1
LVKETKDGILELEGVVLDSSKGKFRVEVSDSLIVLCSLSGKVRMNNVKILTGDRVKIEVSGYNLQLGRIIYRLRS